MEDALTSVDGQCIKTGIGNLSMEKDPDMRDGLFCRRPIGIPAELASLQGKLGRAVFVDPHEGNSCFLTHVAGSFDWYNKGPAWIPGSWWPVWRISGRRGVALHGNVEKLMEYKNRDLWRLLCSTQRKVNTSSR